MLKNNNELYHHGVKGMKWGVVRSRDRKAEKKQERFDKKMARKANVRIRDAELHSFDAKNYRERAEKYKAKRIAKGKDYIKKYDKLNAKALKTDQKVKKNMAKAQTYVNKMSNANLVTGVNKVLAFSDGTRYYEQRWKGNEVMTNKQLDKFKSKRNTYSSVHKIK